MAMERRIRTFDRSDRKARLYIVERDDGLYRCEGEAEGDDADGFGPYWTPSEVSGLYASEAEAEAAARRDVLWFRDQPSA